MVSRHFEEQVNIPSCTLSQESIKELSAVLEKDYREYISHMDEEQYNKKREEDRYSRLYRTSFKEFTESLKPDYKITYVDDNNKDTIIEYNFYSEIEEMVDWSGQINNIEMNLSLYDEDQVEKYSSDKKINKKIEINIDFTNSDSIIFGTKVKITGMNETWVLGTSKKIRDIFKKYKNNHFIFYGNQHVIISMLFGYTTLVLFGMAINTISNVLNINIISSETSISLSGYITLILFILIVGELELEIFIRKIYPKLEYKSAKNIRYKIERGLSYLFGLYSIYNTIYGILSLLKLL